MRGNYEPALAVCTEHIALADLLVRGAETERAALLFSVIAGHSATEHATRSRAEQAMTDLLAQLAVAQREEVAARATTSSLGDLLLLAAMPIGS